MKLVVGIKALNEAKNIARAVESSLDALAFAQDSRPGLTTEVLVADSGSSDQTVRIAQQSGARVVQLVNFAERSCGTGAQLAFQNAFDVHEHGYFYLLDGDMTLKREFLAKALNFLDQNPNAAAVGGIVNELVVTATEFQIKVNEAGSLPFGTVNCIEGGGLYRVAAVRQVGFFADRNLHSFEEFDLGARLTSRGWQLVRLRDVAVDHSGHAMTGYRLLWRRMMSGYAGGCGEVVRGAFGKPHFVTVLRELSQFRHAMIVIAWWGALLMGLFYRSETVPVLLLLPLVFLAWRRGSLSLGLYSLASWNTIAVNFLIGLSRKRTDPYLAISSNTSP